MAADAVLAKVEMDRKLSMVKAWEESEKSKAENKYVGTRQCSAQLDPASASVLLTVS